jgi:hypothetical protein
MPNPSHTLTATSRFNDGHEDTWWYYNRPGTAQEAYAAMKKRWRAAGMTFTHDDKTRTLTRQRDDVPELGPYTDTLTYEGGDDA